MELLVHEPTRGKPLQLLVLLKHEQMPGLRTQHAAPVAEVVGISAPF
jgi:hypothetical protein